MTDATTPLPKTDVPADDPSPTVRAHEPCTPLDASRGR